MTRIDIENSIRNIPLNTIFTHVLRGGRGYSRENAICDEMVLNLGVNFQTRYNYCGKYIDIVELSGGKIVDCLEAKHYSPHQDKDLMYYLFNSAGGPASDSLKLRTLGFNKHYIVQFTSQIEKITGTDKDILALTKGSNNYILLKYLFNNNGGLIRTKITTPITENWTNNLLDFFKNLFDNHTLYGFINVPTVHPSSSVSIKLKFHYYIMEIRTGNTMIVNRYPLKKNNGA